MENLNTIQYMICNNNRKRHTTNENYRNFFLFVCAVWVGCWIPVIFTDTPHSDIYVNRTLNSELYLRNIHIDCKDTVKPWNISDCSAHSVYSALYAGLIKKSKKVDCKKEKCCNDPRILYPFMRVYLYIFTTDPTYLADCKDLMYPLYFIATGIMSIVSLSIAINLLSSHKKILIKQPLVTATAFFFVVFIEHSSQLIISFIFPELWPYDGRLVHWLVPEAVTIAIMLSKMIFSTEGSNDNRREKDSFTYKKIPFSYYTYAIIYGFSFVYILKFFVISTMTALHKTGSANIFYLLIVLCSYIMCHTTYYVGIMSTSYATYMWMDQKKFHPKDLWRAFYIISRYHCGTACKHVTPMLTGFKTYDMAKIQLKEHGYTEDSDPERYDWLAKRSSGLTRALTAIRGYNWCDTISIVSHLVTTIPPHKYFSNFGDYAIIIYGVLMPTNFLTNLLCWNFGEFNTDIGEATWVMYLMIVLAFNLVMEFFKAASDSVGFYKVRQELLNGSSLQMNNDQNSND